MIWYSVWLRHGQTSGMPQPYDVSNHRRRVRASDTPANENRLKFCRQLGLGRGCWPEIGRYEIQFCCGLTDAVIRRWHVHDGTARCTAGSKEISRISISLAGSSLGVILKFRSYPFPYVTISDTCDILFYCVCSSFVWLLWQLPQLVLRYINNFYNKL